MSATQFTSGKGCNNRKLSDEDRAEIVRLYLTPHPDGTWMGGIDLARRFGVRHPVIYRELDRAGVTRRSMSDAHRGKACKPVTRLPVGTASPCACGCGELTVWNQRKNRWNRYVKGHYTQRFEQSHTWDGGKSSIPYSIDWRFISKEIRARDGFRCQTCGSERRLHVHHVDLDKLNNDPSNLITLCNSCHARVHGALLRGGDAK